MLNIHVCMSAPTLQNNLLCTSIYLGFCFRLGMQASRIFSAGQSLQQSSTLSHIESQLAACLLLKSAPEYKFWLQTYTRYLSQEGQCPTNISGHTHTVNMLIAYCQGSTIWICYRCNLSYI